MNILYLHTHDSGRYWSCYGHDLPMPNVREFARQATLFRHCYCAGPTCSPSRAALLTGQSPHACGMNGLAHRGWQLNDCSRHLARFLGGNGYHTALCGIQHEAPEPEMIGYGEILGHKVLDTADSARWDRENTAAAARYLRLRAAKRAEPFFLSLGWFNTHRDYPGAGVENNPDYLTPPWPVYDNAANRGEMAGYARSASVVDECLGNIMRVMDEENLWDDTMVVLTTDHGIAFPHMKCTLYDTGIGVALALRLPGNPSAGRATEALVSHLDLFPTICEAAGLVPPPWLEGTSLTPLLSGEKEAVREEIFSEINYHAAYEPARCVRTDRYKLIRRYDRHNGYMPANIDDGAAKDLLLRAGLLERARPRELLFDLWLDPCERENLAWDGAYREIYRDLNGRLDAWMERTGDPLLDGGAVPCPPGAKVNRLDCISPRTPDYEGGATG